MNTLPVSVNICTYNEEENIKRCVENVQKNQPKEIIVIDGGSNDKTVEIAKLLGAKTIKSPKKGLASQRKIGIENSTQPYIAFVDADDVLTHDCLKTLFTELKKFRFDAIGARVLSADSKTYWQKAMNSLEIQNTEEPKRTNMIGRPALYRKEVFEKVKPDPFFDGAGNEDRDMARKMEKAGFIQGQGTAITYRIHSKTFKDVIKKLIKYGRGDARFIYKHPDRTGKVLFHIIIRHPFIRGIKAVLRGEGKYLPYYFMYGWIRFAVMIPEYFIILLIKPLVKNIKEIKTIWQK